MPKRSNDARGTNKTYPTYSTASMRALYSRIVTLCRRPLSIRLLCVLALTLSLLPIAWAAEAQQITAKTRPAPTPAWNKGIKPVDAESYYNAIECGKQGGNSPACVFWDTGLCENPDFTLTWYTGYKQVAYEVWTAVSRKQPAPQPNFQAAQRQRVTIGVTQVKGATNPLKDLIVTRAGKPATTFERSLSAGGGRFTFDYPAFTPTADVTIQMIGQQKTLTCLLPVAVLRQLR